MSYNLEKELIAVRNLSEGLLAMKQHAMRGQSLLRNLAGMRMTNFAMKSMEESNVTEI